MKIENPAAFQFILQDELYLLNEDREQYLSLAETAQGPVLKEAASEFRYLGHNKKNFLIITHYPEAEFISEKHLAALESTLKRLGYELNDVAIFNRAALGNASHLQLHDFFSPQKLLILGSTAIPPGLNGLRLNERVKQQNSDVLVTFSFDEMMDNVENKKAFWEQLKQL